LLLLIVIIMYARPTSFILVFMSILIRTFSPTHQASTPYSHSPSAAAQAIPPPPPSHSPKSDRSTSSNCSAAKSYPPSSPASYSTPTATYNWEVRHCSRRCRGHYTITC
jgi:hypothetical protein